MSVATRNKRLTDIERMHELLAMRECMPIQSLDDFADCLRAIKQLKAIRHRSELEQAFLDFQGAMLHIYDK